MNKKMLLNACFIAFVAIALSFGIVLAHEEVTVGNYEIEVGWVDEPPVTGQRNFILVNISDSTTPDAEVNISNLIVNVTYGGQTKTLTLQPASEDSTNQYVAAILPGIPGQYTVQLRGKIGDTNVDVDVDPEEVSPVDIILFPSNAGTQGQSNGGLKLTDWLAGSALIIALASLGLAFAAFRKTR